MPPPPIPVRNEGSTSPPIPVRSPRRRPIGGVATVMVSGNEGISSVDRREDKEIEDESSEDASHANNPYDLKAEPGSNVTASYPFHGDEALEQLSFGVGDVIRVKQKEDMWSWGVLERGGSEGWFPHNYVGTTFKPLPGIHEMAAKVRERRERLEAAENREVAGSADAPKSEVADSEDASGKDQSSPPEVTGSGSAGADVLGTTASEANASSNHLTGGSAVSDDEAKGSAAELGGVAQTDVAYEEGVQQKGVGESDIGATAPGHLDAASAENSTTANSTNVPADSEMPKMTPVVAQAPTLPPFCKSSATASTAAPVDAPTKQTDGEQETVKAVDATRIEGVGFAGAPEPASTGCKCSIM